jgi:hypothetical protein
MMKISNITKNRMGTLSFDGKFKGMRKQQDFIVYPLHKDNAFDKLTIQSDTRIGKIDLASGEVTMSPPRQGGSYNIHLMFAKAIDCLSTDELAGLKFRLVQTAGDNVGNNGMSITTDNSNAANVAIF